MLHRAVLQDPCEIRQRKLDELAEGEPVPCLQARAALLQRLRDEPAVLQRDAGARAVLYWRLSPRQPHDG